MLERLVIGDKAAVPDNANRIPIARAIEEFIDNARVGGATGSSLKKYQTLTDQLAAYCDWKGILHVQALDQDAVLEFRRGWENDTAGYKQAKITKRGKPLWPKMSGRTTGSMPRS